MKLLKVLAATAVAATVSFAGKNVAPAPSEPLPVPTPAPAASPFYAGLGLIGAKLSIDCADHPHCHYEDTTYGLMARFGYDFNRYFGIEGRLAKTFWDKGPFGGTPLEHYGLFLKPQLPVGEKGNIYLLLGYGHTKNTGNGYRLTYFNKSWGWSAGIGAEYQLSDKPNRAGWNLFVDYQRLLIKSGAPDLDMISVGAKYKF